MKKVLLISLCLSFSFALYSVGETISLNDQNIVLEGCDSASEYFEQEFKLADWNGDLNGGSYSVIFIDMSASW